MVGWGVRLRMLMTVISWTVFARSFTPSLSEVNVAAAFDLIRERGSGSRCLSADGLQVKAAILMGIEDINSKTDGVHDDILPDIFVNLSQYHYSESSSTDMAIKMIEDFEEEARGRSGNSCIVSCVGPAQNNLGECTTRHVRSVSCWLFLMNWVTILQFLQSYWITLPSPILGMRITLCF